ncbi:MAG TPA: pilus assembly protein TadG-related protein [Candidatus Sulfotelmatobacter sp.]|jgi:Flp pilus assembly protein TadG|nr:pilus assembly protein TadG-related protein [Candidatus Sulfotelmatobacter sp.]
MKAPAIRRSRGLSQDRQEQGVTLVLVAVAMVAIIAMAALSIDAVTLYLAREEAQRSADAAALAAARLISISGITGDPTNASASWQAICGPGGSPASLAATAVARQSTVGSVAATNVNISYSAGGTTSPNDCTGLPFASGVNNPIVTVQVQRTSLPTFFSRMWGRTGNSVSATAAAEVFNPSNSANVGNGLTGSITAVRPRSVKPWIIPNRDPIHPGPNANGFYCDSLDTVTGLSTLPCNRLVDPGTGAIQNPGISLSGTGTNGVIGERLWLEPDCQHTGGICRLRNTTPAANYFATAVQAFLQPPPSVEYLPGEAPSVPPVAIPACASGRAYEEAIGGSDQATVYQCGVQHSASATPNQVDLSENPSMGSNDTLNGVKCLIHESDETVPQPDGQDTLNLTTYPFKILSGSANPNLGGGSAGSILSGSNSIVSVPIYDSEAGAINSTGITQVTIIGFLQVFISQVDQYGNVQVVILNVSGCSNGLGTDPVAASVTGSSPVPVRLITPP